MSIAQDTTREEIIKYYKEKFSHMSDGFYETLLENIKNTKSEKLLENYKKDLARDRNEDYILTKGSKTFQIGFDTGKSKEVEKYMWENSLFTFKDGGFEYRCGNSGTLTGVPEKFVRLLENKYDLQKKVDGYILGREDVESLGVGDKVQVIIPGFFGDETIQGTIYSIEKEKVTTRVYRCSKKAVALRVGEGGEIRKINKFNSNN